MNLGKEVDKIYMGKKQYTYRVFFVVVERYYLC